MWVLRIYEFYEISVARTVTRNIRGSGNKHTCEVQPDIQKFLVAFGNENLFVNASAKGYFSGYVRSPANFSTTPTAIFVAAHRYRKINKRQRAVSCKSSEDIDSGFTGLLLLSAVSRLQPSLLGLRLSGCGFFSFEK